MQARDVMTTNVVTVRPDTSVTQIANTLLDRRISAVPVVDGAGALLGIVSEGDLMRRPEFRTQRRPSWWLAFLTLPDDDLRRFVKANGRYASDVMTSGVVTVDEDATLDQIATILESHHIKRVPITRNGRLVGIVSRADLLRGFAAKKPAMTASTDDRTLRDAVEKAIHKHSHLDVPFISVTVTDGVVHLWGAVEQSWHKDVARVAAENVPGVRSVDDRISVFRSDVRGALWTE